jgi:TIR domain
MPIFLSHKQEDGEKARKIHKYLTDNQVSCYLDCLDEAVSSQKDNITEYLIKKIGECSHLMVVVSQDNTRKSWWIPFEIGIATEKKKRILSYYISEDMQGYNPLLSRFNVEEIEFLKNWPVLKNRAIDGGSGINEEDLNKFIKVYKRDASVDRKESEEEKDISSPGDFHGQLQALLS